MDFVISILSFRNKAADALSVVSRAEVTHENL